MNQTPFHTFKAGYSYFGRSIGDYDCMINMTVLTRTAKTIAVALEHRGTKTYRVAIDYTNNEIIKPWGSYSMAPIISAEKQRL